ncbi:MAG: glycosyltransferase family 2 protein [Robiginitomaculum sp.]
MAKQADITKGVSIIVPTFKRPKGLRVALESLMGQRAGELTLEIIVADNDPKASARHYVTDFSKTSAIKIHYIHVPQPGVSNARNAALKAAKGRYLAFLDDDQEAGKNWLETLVRIAGKYGAGLSFVPTYARIHGKSIYDKYLVDFFSRYGPALEEGVLSIFFGCGNSLLDTKLCTLPTPPFSLDMNETGGEDDLLFGALLDQGIKIAWSRAAVCYEDILPHRATPEYIKVRSFSFGQSPSQECADGNKPFGIVKWMFIGAAQYAVHKPLSIFTKLAKRPSYIKHLAKAAEGAGKVVWFSGFTPKLYGAAVVENKAF